MKTIASILAGAVLAGLIAFFAFDQMNAFYADGPLVAINMAVFVLFIAATTILAATLAIGFRAAIRRGDERLVQRLEARIRALENDPAATPAPAAPPEPLPSEPRPPAEARP